MIEPEMHRYWLSYSFSPGRNGSVRTFEADEVEINFRIRNVTDLRTAITRLATKRGITGSITVLAFSRFED